MTPEERLARMDELASRLHKGQARQDGTPALVHARRVQTILSSALTQSGECRDPDALSALLCGAIGHDLLEDTAAAKEEIAEASGHAALSYIESLTNTFGDDHPDAYTRQVSENGEEVRLIKLSDLIDNLSQASISIGSLGTEWMQSYFLPIVDPMISGIEGTSFEAYAKTGTTLLSTVRIMRSHLSRSIEAYGQEPWGAAH
ncbi:MAG TPA: hypothetical protein VGB97_01145 [Candidatus Paceibacterota bacterium]|jgi:hypothetical protein